MVADLSNPRHFRRDCRDIVRILSFGGVIPREKIEKLLLQAVEMAEKAGEKLNSRAYKRVMDVLLKAAQVEQREKELIPAPQENGLTIEVDLSELNLTDEQLEALDQVRDRLNLPATPRPVEAD